MFRQSGMHGDGGNRARTVRIAAALLLVVLAGCASESTAAAPPSSQAAPSSEGLTTPRTFGIGSADALLTLTPPGPSDKPAISAEQARSEVAHPDGAPRLLKPVLFTLARATATLIGWSGSGAAPLFNSTLAWVGVFEVDPNSPHHCPAEPAASPQSMPPLQAHYYFAVLVNATTNAQATWNEDESGLLMRQCAELEHGN